MLPYIINFCFICPSKTFDGSIQISILECYNRLRKLREVGGGDNGACEVKQDVEFGYIKNELTSILAEHRKSRVGPASCH